MKKMLNAFKAFELQNQKEISGGARITWRGTINGVECCDVDWQTEGQSDTCGIPDKGWPGRVVSSTLITTKVN